MSMARRLIGILLALLVVLPLITVTLTLIAVNGWVLDRGFYKSLANDTRLYELWRTEAQADYRSIQGTTTVDGIPLGAFGNAVFEVARPEYLRDQAMRVIDQTFDILEGRADSGDILVDIAPIKAALRGPDATTFAATLAASLPVCATGANALAPGAAIVSCRMPGDSNQQTADLIAAGLPGYLDRLPDQMNIASSETRFSYQFMGAAGWAIGRFGLLLTIIIMALITATLWLVTALIGAESPGGRLQWLGWMLIAPAALMLLMAPALYSALWSGWFRYNGISTYEAPYFDIFRLAMQTGAGAAVRTVANGFMITGAITAVAGLAGVVAGVMTSRQVSRPKPIDAEPSPVEQ